MKKLFVLVILLFLMTTSVHAETLGEITFRDIPWGCSVTEAMEYLKQDMNIPAEMIVYSEWEMPYSAGMVKGESYNDAATDEVCGYKLLALPSEEHIAGYPLHAVYIFAHYGVFEDGISKEPAESELYAAYYRLSTWNSAIYEDLQGKLCYLYGECVSTKEENKGKHTCVSTWQGDNNTGVTLLYNDSVSYGGNIHIIYYKTDCDEKLGKIEKEIERMLLVEQYENSDLTGL